MAFRKVFYALQDVFPQVDLRILKAVASEHPSDVDAAVEFVLSNVLPVVSEPTETIYALHNNDQAELYPTNSGNDASRSHAVSSCIENPVETSMEVEPKPALKTVPDIFAEHAANAFKSFASGEQDTLTSLPHLSSYDEVSKEQSKNIAAAPADVNSEAKTINNFSALSINIQELSSSTTEVDPSLLESGTSSRKYKTCYVVDNEEESLRNLTETEEFHDFCNSEADDNVLEASSSCGKPSLPFLENCVDSTKCEAGEDVNHDSSIDIHEQERSTNSTESIEELVGSPQSGQTAPIDSINRHISDLTKSKDTLSSALESTVVKMKDVEIHEENARQAKEAADVAGQDILAAVEDYDKRIKTARESNEKQSGEVCKEKSLLAAESQELQSRLMNLSAQKDMFLSIIEEINDTLDARLTAATEEQAAAMQEIGVKEKLARQTRKEKEAVMEKIVGESQRLQKDAEENTKLKEFLLDRGHIVDTLQKEISAICLNVASLRERVNGATSLNKSLSPSSSSLASSTCSVYNTSLLFGRAPSNPPASSGLASSACSSVYDTSLLFGGAPSNAPVSNSLAAASTCSVYDTSLLFGKATSDPLLCSSMASPISSVYDTSILFQGASSPLAGKEHTQNPTAEDIADDHKVSSDDDWEIF